ncbi:NAD(P)/FAD-dependent oxidoreductase [Paeniglutamicibacter cryotolerans]|uniref:Alkyl hydroperoxide reductase subunit AhpF n=1 Tax=Paeniglutamicibacter cryotolerans TaxID=670079 RepID=A0A839QTH1_9MICC|nr:hypothetical protein [Paeniglutamicibacter cryotolerans]MBB2996572.1 alkyl hydroperoxide reductase subunit AhpF [Paeniglutamicibacter cryotolerans]
MLELLAGSRFAEPVMRDVARAAGLEVDPADLDYDLVILGCGPARLPAAVNGAAEGLRSVVIVCLDSGGQTGTSARIENWTGFRYGISGDDLAGRALTQARHLGAESMVTRTARMIDTRSHSLVLAGETGCGPRLPSSPRRSNGGHCRSPR